MTSDNRHERAPPSPAPFNQAPQRSDPRTNLAWSSKSGAGSYWRCVGNLTLPCKSVVPRAALIPTRRESAHADQCDYGWAIRWFGAPEPELALTAKET